ncbi:MAG: hypothetical protein HGA65_11880, partial [Oscillochloris sp.]|nr:hypothetical protein [Oscillochloris sp.]
LLVSEQHAGQIAPSTPRVGLRLAARVVSTSERAVVEILTLVDPDRPAPGQSVRVAIYRAGDSDGDPVISRNAISDIQGRRDVQLVQLQPGAYTVVATLGDQSSHVGLWVVGGRYAGWANSPGQVAVISDRASYRPGDVAQLLVTQPYARAQLLLSSEQGKLLSVTAYELRASQLITLSITPEMAPAVTIGALIAAGGERLVGSSRLYVVDDRPRLSVDLASDATRYSPASSATLSITASIGGVPSAADVLVRIEPAQVAGGLPPLAEFAPGPPLPLATAMLRAEVDEGESDKTRSSTVVVQGDSGSALQADDRIRLDGHATLRVTLPDISGDWRISAYAVSDDGQVATSTQIVTTRDALEFSLSAPQMLRTSDQAVLSLLVHNTLSISQSLQIGLEADGGKIDATTPSERQVILAPGDSQRLNWRVGPQAGARVIKLRYALSGEPPIAQLSRDLTIEAAASPANESTTSRPEASRSIILQQEYLDPQSDGPINLSNLRSGALLRLRVSLICTEQIAQANLEIPLPGGLQPLKLIAQPPFATAEPADEAGHQLLVRAANLSPGVYSITALVRADAQGRFSAPGARLRIGNDATPIVALPPGQRLIIGKDEQP